MVWCLGAAQFIDKAREYKRFGRADSVYQTGPYFRNKRILILGSGGLQIGQVRSAILAGSACVSDWRL